MTRLVTLAIIVVVTSFLSNVPVGEATTSNSLSPLTVHVPIPVILETRSFRSPITEPTGISDQELIELVKKDSELRCMAMNIYHEARGENTAGKFAVADVVLNRVESSRFPNTVCDVVHQGVLDSNGNPVKHKCQFSWWCDGRSDKTTDTEAWIDSKRVAYEMLIDRRFRGITEGSDHYHVADMNKKPFWITAFNEIGNIGDHTFYVSQ